MVQAVSPLALKSQIDEIRIETIVMQSIMRCISMSKTVMTIAVIPVVATQVVIVTPAPIDSRDS